MCGRLPSEEEEYCALGLYDFACPKPGRKCDQPLLVFSSVKARRGAQLNAMWRTVRLYVACHRQNDDHHGVHRSTSTT